MPYFYFKKEQKKVNFPISFYKFPLFVYIKIIVKSSEICGCKIIKGLRFECFWNTIYITPHFAFRKWFTAGNIEHRFIASLCKNVLWEKKQLNYKVFMWFFYIFHLPEIQKTPLLQDVGITGLLPGWGKIHKISSQSPVFNCN